MISVDWEPLARSPWYTSAAKNSRLVGKYTAEFIKFLVEEGGSTYDSFHVLGASLGAHAAGFVGHYSEVCKVMSAQFFKLKLLNSHLLCLFVCCSLLKSIFICHLICHVFGPL